MKENKRGTGFTLMECLLALLVLSYMLLIFSFLTKIIEETQCEMKLNSRKEFEVFLLQLEQETQGYELEAVIDNKIFLKRNSSVQIQIKQVGTRIDKKDSGGTQPLLTQINRFKAKHRNHAVEIEVTFNDGKTFQGKWIESNE